MTEGNQSILAPREDFSQIETTLPIPNLIDV